MKFMHTKISWVISIEGPLSTDTVGRQEVEFK